MVDRHIWIFKLNPQHCLRSAYRDWWKIWTTFVFSLCNLVCLKCACRNITLQTLTQQKFLKFADQKITRKVCLTFVQWLHSTWGKECCFVSNVTNILCRKLSQNLWMTVFIHWYCEIYWQISDILVQFDNAECDGEGAILAENTSTKERSSTVVRRL